MYILKNSRDTKLSRDYRPLVPEHSLGDLRGAARRIKSERKDERWADEATISDANCRMMNRMTHKYTEEEEEVVE